MKHFVDVLSVQYLPDPTPEGRDRMVRDLRAWHAYTDKPVILADICNWTPTELNPARTSLLASQAERGADYVDSLDPLLQEPWFLGWHWCGYVENTARGWGLKDPWDEPYEDLVSAVRALNTRATSCRA